MKKQMLNKLLMYAFALVLVFSGGCTKKDFYRAGSETKKKTNMVQEEDSGEGEDARCCRVYLPTPDGNFSPTRWVVADNFQISERLDVNVQDIQIEVKIWADQTSGQRCSLDVPVDNDFVIIGGGARIRSMDNNAPDVDINAALTAMHPVDDGNFNKYTASSKDHEVPYPHKLVVYAVGLKVYYYSAATGGYVGFPASAIRSQMHMVHTTAPFQNGQAFTATLPQPYYGNTTMLCGGSKLSWPIGQSGLLLTEAGTYSGPRTRTMGKDHAVTTLGGTVESFLLYFDNQNPQNPVSPLVFVNGQIVDSRDLNDGYFVSVTQSHQTMVQHVFHNQAYVGGKYLLSSLGGAMSTYTGYGRMIYALYPIDGATAEFSTKDHLEQDISGQMSFDIHTIKPAHFQHGYQGF